MLRIFTAFSAAWFYNYITLCVVFRKRN